MGLTLVLFVLIAGGCHGDQIQIPTNDQGFAKAVVNSYDGNRSFSENFYSLLAILCPKSVHCTNNVADFFNIGNHTANNSSDFSEDFAIVYNNAERLHSCCVPCSCDQQCTERVNCCPGAAQDVLQTEDTSRVIQECVFAGISSYIPNAVVTDAEATGFSYFMVTDCFSANVSEDISTRCRRPELGDTGPVYSPATERIYKNKFCAVCNGDDHVVSWRPIVNFIRQFSLTGKLQIPSTWNALFTSFRSARFRKFLNLLYMPPDNMTNDKHTCALSDGMKEWKNPCKDVFDFDSTRFLERACAAGGIGYESPRGRYANVFCFLCDFSAFPSTSVCDGLTKSFLFSFSAFLGFKDDPPTEARTTVSDAPCDCRKYYDHAKNLCRILVCPPGEYFAPCACAEFLQNMRGMSVKINLEIHPKLQSREEMEMFTTKLNNKALKSFKANVEDIISTRWGPLDINYSTLFRETSVSDRDYLKFHIAIATTLHGTIDNRKLVKSMFTTIQSGISVTIIGSPMTIQLGPIFNVSRNSSETDLALAKAINSTGIVIESFKSNDVDIGFVKGKTYQYAQTVSKLVYCQRVVLEEEEVAVLKTRPRDLGVAPAYLPYVFFEQDGSMCLEDFKATFLASSGSNPWARSYMGVAVYLLMKWSI